jgi:hypothetical protein
MLHLDSLLIGRTRTNLHSPHRGTFYHPDRGEKIFFLIIMIFEGRGLTSNFLCGGDVDVFWNDPIPHFIFN